MPDLASDDQRWTVYDLFSQLGCTDIEQVRADARRILKLDYLADLRDLTSIDADYLISELRRSLAHKRVSDDQP